MKVDDKRTRFGAREAEVQPPTRRSFLAVEVSMTCGHIRPLFDRMILQLLLSFWSTWPIMKGLALLLIVLLLSIYHLDAFLTNPYHPHTSRSLQHSSIYSTNGQADSDGKLTHEDIIWKLRPSHGTSLWKRITIRLASNIVRIESKLKGQVPPFCLCPKGGQAVLEAHVKGSGKIGKFGLTTTRGPSAPQINQSVEELFGIELNGRTVASAALIYMFVEPEHRKKGVGELALEVISVIHAMQGCDVTMLVADDDGSGKLVEWYEEHGFKQAPKLQDMLGSPNGKYGVTMIGGANQQISPACQLQWW